MTLIDQEWLIKYGVDSTNKKQLKSLAEIALSELELRVGTKLVEVLSDKQIAEFEKIEDEDLRLEWLENAYPDYKKIVALQADKLGVEIKQSKDKNKLINSWKY